VVKRWNGFSRVMTSTLYHDTTGLGWSFEGHLPLLAQHVAAALRLFNF
jgi:hypothetical protein